MVWKHAYVKDSAVIYSAEGQLWGLNDKLEGAQTHRCQCRGLTALGHDGGVLPQHGGGRLGQGDDYLQSQLPLHVGQVGVATQLGSKGGREVSKPGAGDSVKIQNRISWGTKA